MVDDEVQDGDRSWWRHAVVYQVYVRSFADGNGDGVGDLAGVRSRLPYLRDLGVDALWFTPWYASPWADGGYDVSDYRAIHPLFGSLTEAEDLIAEAAGMGMRTIVDVVPNHVSDQHEWFRQALAAGAGAPERERFWFHPGKGPGGHEIPTRWPSEFAGSTWSRTTNPDGSPGEWYLHIFAPEQPDLNWNHPDVHAEFLDILRFWFDRGAAGVRVDSAALLVKDPEMPEMGPHLDQGEHPFIDRAEVHEVYRGWRALADAYDPPRLLVGEVWVSDSARLVDYLRPDELHTAFNFDLLTQPWDAASLRASISGTIESHRSVGAPATWVLANHDVVRTATRYGRVDTAFSFTARRFGLPSDRDLGLRRARAATLLVGALPGSLYVYQGEELGLPEVEDLPDELRQDPTFHRSEGAIPGRDGCRVPLPWSGDRAPFGFSPDAGTTSWLPQPEDWRDLTVEVQAADPTSMLSLYRTMLRLRRDLVAERSEALEWLHLGAEVLAFRLGVAFVCVVNLGRTPVTLPEHAEVLLTSAPLEDGRLPTDSAAWLRTGQVEADAARGSTPTEVRPDQL